MTSARLVPGFVRALTSSIVGIVLLLAPASILAQEEAPLPTILSFDVAPTEVEDLDGEWVEFSWETRGADRVRLYENNREVKGRIRLRDGDLGLPTTLTGGFETQVRGSTTFELVAENEVGKASETITVQENVRALEGAYTVEQVSSERYLDAHQGRRDNSVVTRDRQNNATQIWLFTPVGRNEYTIRQQSSGRYLDAHQGRRDNSVVTRDRQNNDTQVWIVKVLAGDVYTIQQKSNRRYLDAHQGRRDNSVVTRDRQNNDTQRWRIVQR